MKSRRFTVTFLFCSFVLAACSSGEPELLAAEPLRGFDGELVTDAVDDEPTLAPPTSIAFADELVANDDVALDRYLLSEFPNLSDRQRLDYFNAALLVCRTEPASRDTRFFNEEALSAVSDLDEATCEALTENAGRLFVRAGAPPTGAASWEEVIAIRYGRAAMRIDQAEFGDLAGRACQTMANEFDLLDELTLTHSASTEIGLLMSSGECSFFDGEPLNFDDFTYGSEIQYAFSGLEIAQLTNEQHRCIDDELVAFNVNEAPIPTVVVEHVARLCAPERAASEWADSDSIALPDSDDRVCFAEVVIEVTNSNFWENIQWFQSRRFDPPDRQRDSIDNLLQQRCGIDVATGVAAGLRDRGPLEPTEDITIYCAAVADRATTPGYGPGADNATTLAWLERELFGFTGLALPDPYVSNHNFRLLAIERAFLLANDGATFDEIQGNSDYLRWALSEDVIEGERRMAEFEVLNCS